MYKRQLPNLTVVEHGATVSARAGQASATPQKSAAKLESCMTLGDIGRDSRLNRGVDRTI